MTSKRKPYSVRVECLLTCEQTLYLTDEESVTLSEAADSSNFSKYVSRGDGIVVNPIYDILDTNIDGDNPIEWEYTNIDIEPGEI